MDEFSCFMLFYVKDMKIKILTVFRENKKAHSMPESARCNLYWPCVHPWTCALQYYFFLRYEMNLL